MEITEELEKYICGGNIVLFLILDNRQSNPTVCVFLIMYL